MRTIQELDEEVSGIKQALITIAFGFVVFGGIIIYLASKVL